MSVSFLKLTELLLIYFLSFLTTSIVSSTSTIVANSAPLINGNNHVFGPSNQSEAYFNGSSYLRLPSVMFKKQPGLSFRTCHGGNLFSQRKNNEFVALYVNNEGIVFHANALGKQFEETIYGNFLDNKWHTVYLQNTDGNLTVFVDKTAKLLSNTTYNNALLTTTILSEGIFIVGQQFNGCIQEGPSIVFDTSNILTNHNVDFQQCPIPLDSCVLNDVTTPKAYNFCLNAPCMMHGECVNGVNTYTCVCNPRYTGKNCEIDMGDPCSRDICKNGAHCTSDATGAFNCTCKPGFSGPTCEIARKLHPLCNKNPCKNGATCDVAVKPNGGDEIFCHCRPGFDGVYCENNINECSGQPCLNGGLCIDLNNNFTCDCVNTGYEGRHCEHNLNECLQNPCQNGGICFDTYGSYLCQCQLGFAGKDCQTILNECTPQTCFNDGICIETATGYSCRCKAGFAGDHCEIEQNLCQLDSCPNFAECVVLEPGKIDCVCKKEYVGVYPNCSISSVCANNPCKNGGVCSAVNGNFNCSCLPGFAGKMCQINIDECASMPCQNGGSCTDLINGFSCTCTDQFMGPTCELPYDACLLHPCQNNGTCTITGANKHDYTCSCPSGFEGDHCEINVDDCVGKKCPPAMICVDLINNFECRCPPGYTGENCSLDVDPCSKDPCLNGASCQVNPGSHTFTCVCPPGFTGLSCDKDIDECAQGGPQLCNHGICVNTNGSFQCYCKPGYTGERCNLDFNECLSMPCRNNATCLNKINNYECICPLGYEGKDCSVNIDECAPQPCAEGATCIDGINSFTCECQPGLTGKLCDVNIDDCDPNPCQNGAHCIDGLNSYVCNCSDTGYEGVHCEINIDDCLEKPCLNGAQCVDKVKDYECKCYSGYEGKNCESDINECQPNPCKFGGLCLEKSNQSLYIPPVNENLSETFQHTFNFSSAAGYECLCPEGVIGLNCEQNINECESNPCQQGQCTDEIGGYTCECDEGFEGKHCEIDINECDKYKPCVRGNCIDRRANYICECEANFGGKNCSVELIGCNSNPCLNSGTCVPYLVNEVEHKFNCSCPNGFHGHTCDQITTMSLNGQSLITVNTAREEGYDVQFRFKTTLGDGLLALGKGLTYYILELSKGRLNLHSSLLNKWEGVFIGSNLNDSNWQRVFVAINSTHLVLGANDEQTIYPISINENYNTSSTSFPLTYFGGIPSNLRKLTHGQPFLVGCTEDILINNDWVLPNAHEAAIGKVYNGVNAVNNMQFQNIEVGCSRQPQCTPNPCHSGGHCTDRWRDFSCTCERPHLGHTCQYNYTAATFGYENITDSLVTVDVADFAKRAVRSIVDISMFIRTRQPKGQIFYLGSPLGGAHMEPDESSYIAAQLEGGELLVRIQFNGSLESYTVGGVKLNNGYNHLIEVIRNVTFVQVKLNGTEYFRKTISASGNLDAQVLYLGGLPQLRAIRQVAPTLETTASPATTTALTAAITTPSTHFKGIIQDVQISNGSNVMVVEFFPLQAPDLEIPAGFGEVTFDPQTVLPGVQSDDSCRENPCQHDGSCENTWNDYRCSCTKGFKGKNCTEYEFCELEECPPGGVCKNLDNGYECVANATFNGKMEPLQYGLAILPDSTRNDLFDSIEITYRTRSWGTILFLKHGSNYFAVFVYHNEVTVEWSLDGATKRRKFQRDKFQGQWITIFISYKENILKGGFKEMVLDENPNFEVNDFNFTLFEQLIKNGSIYLAGSDNKTFNYREIIDEIALNSTGYVILTNSVTSGEVNQVDGKNPLPVTPIMMDSSEEVQLLYKMDHNKQTDRFKGCLGEIRIGHLLLPYFTTDKLKNRNVKEFFELLLPNNLEKVENGCILCHSTDCFNGGQCISPQETYSCKCSKGYTADDCSIDINECDGNKCQNNATCLDLIGRYQCQCPIGYNGEFCENDINECASNPCKNGGTCIDLIGTFKCECPEGIVGKQCEAPLLITCDNRPCREGATCKSGHNEITGNNFTCLCTEGMEGPLCDQPFCLLNHCENGQCNTTSEVPFCTCSAGFEGKFCEINHDDCVSPIGGSICQNGGICIDGVNGFDCNCTGTGYKGVLCENDVDECNQSPNPCGMNGKCENTPGSYRCICDIVGQCGHHCKLDDLCITEKPCGLNGHCISHCTDVSDYVCNCNEQYIGKNCTEPKVATSKIDGGINVLYIVLPIVFLLLLGLAVGLAVLVNVARSKRATRGTYSPSAQEFCNPRVELDHVLKPPPEERLI